MDVKTKPWPRSRESTVPSKAAKGEDLYSVKRRVEDPSVVLGRRDLNKVDKVRRISAAARQQFAEKGYDGTTLREIAQEAGVALGTIGFYAETKQELVLLIFNQVMSDLVVRVAKAAKYDSSLVEAFIKFFRPMYAAFAEDIALYRILLRENVFHATSQHAVEFQRHRGVLVAGLAGLIRRAADAGEVRAALDAELAARTAFFVFFAAVRWWISSPDPDVKDGLADLRRMLALLVGGFKA